MRRLSANQRKFIIERIVKGQTIRECQINFKKPFERPVSKTGVLYTTHRYTVGIFYPLPTGQIPEILNGFDSTADDSSSSQESTNYNISESGSPESSQNESSSGKLRDNENCSENVNNNFESAAAPRNNDSHAVWELSQNFFVHASKFLANESSKPLLQ